MPTIAEIIQARNPASALEKEVSKLARDLESLARQFEKLQSDSESLKSEIKAEVQSELGKVESQAGILRHVESLKGTQGPQGNKGDRGESIIGPQGERGQRGLLGPKGEDGKAGRDGKDGLKGEIGAIGLAGKDGENGSPDTPDQVIEKIHDSKKLIQREKIDGLVQFLGNLQHAIREKGGGVGGGGLGTPVHQSFSTSSVTTTLTLSNNVAANGFAIWAYYNGQFIVRGNHYTISGKIITLTFIPSDSTNVDVIYFRT